MFVGVTPYQYVCNLGLGDSRLIDVSSELGKIFRNQSGSPFHSPLSEKDCICSKLDFDISHLSHKIHTVVSFLYKNIKTDVLRKP